MAKAKIMIVEDDKAIAMAIQMILKRSDYQITGIYSNGEEALASFNTLVPDIVIMDCVLQGKLSGIDTATEIRRQYDIPLIYLTAYATEEVIEHIKQTQPDAFMSKPFQEKDLLINIDLCLYKHNMLKHNESLVKHLQDEMLENCAKSAQIKTLLHVSTMINSSLNIQEIKTKTIEAAMIMADAEAASLLLIDEITHDLFFDVALGTTGEDIKNIHIPQNCGIVGNAIKDKKAIIVNNAQEDPDFYPIIDQELNFTTRNIVCIPIKLKDKMIGVLEILNKKNGHFYDVDLHLLNALANQIAVALDNANLYENQKHMFYSIITALVETIDKKDVYTGGHSKRVQEYSLMIARGLGLTDAETNRLELASILHDVGKIGITDQILNKNSTLTDEEFNEIKKHPVYGEEILKHFADLKDIIPGIKHHHERYDGQGYPDHLIGDNIDIIARIIAVADAYDAMISGRSYKAKITPQDAIAEISRCKGTQFDPKIADLFCNQIKQII